ncbi:MAG: terminase family protein [Hyphomonadaceae bacterium]|nr:terminase family protein [Hyphomonadaceae bacterium]
MLHQLLSSGLIDDEAAQVAAYDFDTWWAREGQLMPDPQTGSQIGGPWQVWLLLAGRGYGKTRSGVEFARKKAEAGIGPGAIVGRTSADVRDVLIEGPSGLLAMSPPWFRPTYEPAKRRVTWPNGVTATLFSSEAPDQLRGPQHAWALADELAAWSYIEEAWSNLMFGLRLGDQPQVAALTTPRPKPLIKKLLQDPTTAITRGSTLDNAMNLAKSSLDYMIAKYAGTRLGKQEIDGILLEDLPGALWPRAILESCLCPPDQIYTPEMFERIVIAVDPSGSDGENVEESEQGDDQGIVVAGKFKNLNEYAVLEDCTGQRSPEEWARETKRLYQKWGADLIVAEKNFGGAMVRATLQMHDANLPVKLRSAARGKHIRAEPVAMLYEQKRVKHARGLGLLEEELAQFTTKGYEGGSSPNRADAAVWALDELCGGALNTPRVRTLGRA